LWRSPLRTPATPQALLHRLYLDLMFVQISWTACFMKSLFSSTHSRTSLLLVAPATLGVQQSLPSPLCILSTSHLSTLNQMILMSLHIAEVSSPSVCLIINGSLVTLPRKTYPFNVQCLKSQNTPNEMHYLSCSHGYLIFTCEEHCLLVDAYTGAKVKAPELPCNNNLGYSSVIGVLTDPFSSPNSCLLLFSRASMFEWQVGTNA
jgi:hypothetical protein